MADRLHKPLFFIGFPRSGTTVIFETFGRHHAVGWPSVYSEMFPRLAALNGIRFLLDNRLIRLYGRKKQYASVMLGNRYLPAPSEAYAFWDHYTQRAFSTDYLLNTEASELERDRVRRAAEKVITWQNKGRFAAKLTGPSRIRYLRSIFPDAKFIHIVRDGRAAVRSLLTLARSQWRGFLDRPHWRNGLPQEDREHWEGSGRNPAVLGALQWRFIVETTRREGSHLGDDYCELRYEDFVADPHAHLRELFRHCGLEDSRCAHAYLDEGPQIQNMNRVTSDALEWGEARMSAIMTPLLQDLGYVEVPPRRDETAGGRQ